jgi:peptidyl-tRNA hydrolase, PTH1 family
MTRYLVAGLGNIGAEYVHTRHNVGFDVLDAFVLKHGGSYQSARLADKAEVRIKGRTVICIKPTTFMNLSGKAVKYWLDKEEIEMSNLLVVTDDLALPLSKIKLKGSGSDGGHNGLSSVQESLGTTQYPRLRVGIGNQFPKGMQVDFVLGKWFPEERERVLEKILKCSELIEDFVFMGLERTMNKANNLRFGE